MKLAMLALLMFLVTACETSEKFVPMSLEPTIIDNVCYLYLTSNDSKLVIIKAHLISYIRGFDGRFADGSCIRVFPDSRICVRESASWVGNLLESCRKNTNKIIKVLDKEK